MTSIELGRRGGLARAKKLSKEKLSEIGRKGAAAYWAKYPDGDPKRRRKKKKKKKS